ncbi:hypothetical protein K8I31_14900, partial [bacterium]|nr:hypothetical protein [bacterium]
MMKRIFMMAGTASAALLFAQVQAGEVLRLNFDEDAVEKVAIPYLGGPSDIIPDGVVIDLDDFTNGRPQECSDSQGAGCEEPFVDVSEPEIFEPDEEGVQGGNVLFLDQEDTENPQGEGLYVSGIGPLTEAWTVEVVFRTYDPLFAPAEYNIQNIIGTENAPDPALKFQ